MKPTLLTTVVLALLTAMPACSLRSARPPAAATDAAVASSLTKKEASVPTPECTISLSPEDSLQAAVDKAEDGTTICLQPGVYGSELEITRSITIRGLSGDPRATTLLSGGNYAVITVKKRDIAVVIEGLTLRGGGEDSGGGLFLDTWADVTLRRCRIEGNSSYIVGGGGIYMHTGRLWLEDCILEGNEAEEDGGAILMNNDSELVMRGGAIIGNRAGSGAALTLRGGTALLEGVTIRDNEATNQEDPNIYLRGGSRKPIHLTLRGCTLDEAEQASLKQRFPDRVTVEP
jgi:nitrous oxidase accessory protein NosD